MSDEVTYDDVICFKCGEDVPVNELSSHFEEHRKREAEANDDAV